MFFNSRLVQFNNDIAKGARNEFNSPVFDILKISILYGLYREVCKMLIGVAVFSKRQWKEIVWKRAWQIEEDSWNFTTRLFDDSKLISRVMGIPGYCIWWQIADDDHAYMRRCEVIVRILCNVSQLKCDDYRLDNAMYSEKGV